MQTFETTAHVGPNGRLMLENLPFEDGQDVRVRIEAKLPPTAKKPGFAFGLHAGLIEMSDDFNDELPMSFWLGEEDKNAPAP